MIAHVTAAPATLPCSRTCRTGLDNVPVTVRPRCLSTARTAYSPPLMSAYLPTHVPETVPPERGSCGEACPDNARPTATAPATTGITERSVSSPIRIPLPSVAQPFARL